MYAIAERIPIEVRTLAASRRYEASSSDDDGNDDETGMPFPLDEEGYCPLGWCLAQMGHQSYNHQPVPVNIAFVLAVGLLDEAIILGEVREFTEDWDNGRITDLAAAFGVDGR